MLNKIIISVFVGMIFAISITASATVSESAVNVKSSLNSENNTANKVPLMQTTSISSSEDKIASSQPLNKSEPAMPTGWLLTMALFGFVMLSNRSGV